MLKQLVENARIGQNKSCLYVFIKDWVLVLLPHISLFSLKGIHADLFIIFLKSSKILSCLRELSLLHALPDISVDKGPLGIHQVKLVVKPGPRLGNGGGVAQHADGPGYLG